MKKLFTLFAVIALLAGCSDDYDDSALTGRVDDLENRIEKLEEFCKQMNTNISSLQTIVTALQNNDYITEVIPVMQDGKEIGYTITFDKSNPITIYHGENGQDGKPGNDGHMPVIGVRQDTDGIYYWTLNGEWLTDDEGNKIKAQGADGQDGKPGEDGKPGTSGEDGAPGQDGKPGKDGITPKLKIENGYWYVSYDNEQTWKQLGKATGEDGEDGKPGEGDSIFQSVTQDEYNVYFTLTSGEKITLPKKSTLAIKFAEGNSLIFQVDETKTVHYTITGGNTENVIKAEMMNNDGAYTLRTTPSSATVGTIEISAKIPTVNRVIVSVSDGSNMIMAAIDVSIAPSLDNTTITVVKPGSLSKLLSEYDKTTITELTIIGSLNDVDIQTLKLDLPNLSVLDIENVNLEIMGDYAFMGKTSLTSIVLPKTLKIIEERAFWACSGLTGNLTIPESVTTIGEAAFCACSGLTGNLTIPESVTTIGSSAFDGCSGFTGNLTIPESITTIESSAFKGCSGFTGNLTIPESVTTIGSSAFNGCSGFTGNLTIPESVTMIGDYTFYECTGFTGNLTIPESVTMIGEWAFYGCSGFTGNLTIPSSVTTIGYYAFVSCSSLTNVYCKATIPPQINSPIFSSPFKLTLYVPTGYANTYCTAPGWSEITFKEIIETNF